MTPEKAIKFLDEEIVRLDGAPIINGCEMTDDWRGHLEICKLAKSALEKQIPKKPEALNYIPLLNSGWKYQCPNCGCAIGKNKNLEFAYEEYLEADHSNCMSCGQALDWSDTGETT